MKITFKNALNKTCLKEYYDMCEIESIYKTYPSNTKDSSESGKVIPKSNRRGTILKLFMFG